LSPLTIAAKMLRASQQAYDVTAGGLVAIRPPYDQIGWLNPPQGFAVGLQRVDAALVGETDSEAIVAFRGTLPLSTASPDDRQVLLDWLGDLDALLVPGAHLPGLVHQGFLGALDVLWAGVAAAIPAGKPLYMTGHSKGGALANLAAARYAALNPQAPPPIVTTFGAAKPGDDSFAAAYDRLVPHSVRYENRDDIVPHLPPGLEFQAMFRNFDLFAPAVARAAAALPPGVGGFVGVGELKFIDWTGGIVADSPTLRFHRYLALAQLAVTFNLRTIIDDHTSGDEGGYAKAVLPPNAPPMVSQAVPGVSRVA
jgi:hypothetical protein